MDTCKLMKNGLLAERNWNWSTGPSLTLTKTRREMNQGQIELREIRRGTESSRDDSASTMSGKKKKAGEKETKSGSKT